MDRDGAESDRDAQMAWWNSLGEGWEAAADDAGIAFASRLDRILQEDGLDKAELARRLDVSPATVTKLLRGGAPCTLEMMAKAAFVLGRRLRITVDGPDA